MKPGRILFIQTAFLGDVVFSTALLGKVRSLFPEATLTVLASPRGGGILSKQSFVDEVLLYDKAGRESGLQSLYRLMKKLRARRFDIVVSPHRSFRSAVIARLCGAPLRAGFLGVPGGWAYNISVPFDKRQKIPYRRELAIAEKLGAGSIDSARPHLEVGETARMRARRTLETAGAPKGRPLVGLITGTVWPTKKWPLENFLSVAEVMKHRGCGVAVFGGHAEAVEAAEFNGVEGAVNLAGKTALDELPALLTCCDVVVAADTGPLHIAMALGVPVVALFGPTDERQFEFRERDRCLVAEARCRPCSAHGSRECPEGNWICMTGIPVSAATRAIEEIAGAGGGTEGASRLD